jgi:ABC-type sugar transport system substrate-binding protein
MSVNRRKAWLGSLAVLGLATVVAVTATASASTVVKKPSAVWTAEDIAKVARANGVPPFTPVYAVPKRLPERYKIGFINPDLSNTFFATWSKAMRAAAKLYGVEFVEANAATRYERETDLYDTLAGQNIDAVGAHPGNVVIAQKAAAAKIPFITVDSQVPGASRIGIPDVQAGQLAARLLSVEIKKRQQGAWKNKKVVFVGLGAPGCTPCEVRPHTAERWLGRSIKLADATYIPQYATPDVGQRFMTDLMTAHRNDVFAIVPLNDQSLIGVVQALRDAGRTQDAAIVSLGGDPTGRRLLRQNPKMVFAAIDFHPFAEAWNFVAAAIARIQGKGFRPYKLSTTLTPQNVDKLYPSDRKP